MGTEEHERFMRMAIKLSEDNVKRSAGGPFGAVVVKDGKVISKSANKVLQQNDPTAHAEVAAIRQACRKLGTYDLKGCVIYTSCEPCPMCLGAIYWAHIDTIYYGNTKADAAAIGFDDHFIYQEIELPLDRRTIAIKQILPHEAIAVFKQWEISGSNAEY